MILNDSILFDSSDDLNKLFSSMIVAVTITQLLAICISKLLSSQQYSKTYFRLVNIEGEEQ
ncbi:hypothetical protein BLOT_014773 [Blomia tropicalis]|nr:hypothetical protein BLOT_014773 [Blomia tropicalis]